jgi:hypothetical protein
VGVAPDVAPAARSGWVPVGLHLGGYLSQMADPDLNDSDLLQRAKQAQNSKRIGAADPLTHRGILLNIP